MPTDEELVGEQMTATEKKNVAREDLKTAIRSILTRVSTSIVIVLVGTVNLVQVK